MTNLKGVDRSHYIQGTFARIATQYDLMNRLMTFGQDLRWRREVITLANPPINGLLLDIGAGTGDLSIETIRQFPTCQVIAGDFTGDMIKIGISRSSKFLTSYQKIIIPSITREHPKPFIIWSAMDALDLPFSNNVFDAIVTGFLLRNLSELPKALSEQYRVLKPGGKLIVLDACRPRHNILYPFIHFYLHTLIPLMGRLLVGDGEAYTYLPDSIEHFLRPDQLKAHLENVGFQSVGYKLFNVGTIAIHWGEK